MNTKTITITIPSLPSMSTDNKERLDTTKAQLNAITKKGRKRMAKGLKKLAKRIGGAK